MVQDMTETIVRQPLHTVCMRMPEMLWDCLDQVWAVSGEHFSSTPPSPDPDNSRSPPSWCVCAHCQEMPTARERRCCRLKPEHCISQRHVSKHFFWQWLMMRNTDHRYRWMIYWSIKQDWLVVGGLWCSFVITTKSTQLCNKMDLLL